MQHWNQHYSERNREDYKRKDNEVTNRQSDFNNSYRQQENNFNMPYGNEGFGQPYTNMHKQDDVYSNYDTERYRSRQLFIEENDRHIEQDRRKNELDWQNPHNRAEDFTGENNMMEPTGRNHYLRTQNPNNYGETYNPDNRNYNPLFADDEGGFSGGHNHNSEPFRSGFKPEFGFDSGNSFYNNHPQYRNDHEVKNRWHIDDQPQNHGGFFGH